MGYKLYDKRLQRSSNRKEPSTMQLLVFVVAATLVCLGTSSGQAAFQVLPQVARISLNSHAVDARPGDGNVESSAGLIIDVFFALSSQADFQFLPGTQVSVYNAHNQRLATGTVISRPRVNEDSPLTFWSKNGRLPSAYANFAFNLSAAPLHGQVGGDDPGQWASYAGPMFVSVLVPEPASLVVWSVLAGSAAGLAVCRRRRAAAKGRWSNETGEATLEVINGKLNT